jgi:hypothetical protein
MLYALVIVSCMSDGSDCMRRVEAEGFGMTGCLSQSQSIGAQWQAQHPRRVIKALRCVDIRRLDFELGRDQA